MRQIAPLRPEDAPLIRECRSPTPAQLGLAEGVRYRSSATLNRLLSNKTALRDRDKKAHWQTSDQTRRLADAHEFILVGARPPARKAAAAVDEGSNGLVVGELVRGNDLQSWFVQHHLSAHRSCQ